MKEIIRLLNKDNKEFISFKCDNGMVVLNYLEGHKSLSCNIGDNEVLNVRTIRIIDSYLHKLLNLL